MADSLRIGKHHGVAEIRVNDLGKDGRLVASAVASFHFLDGSAFSQKTT